MLKQASGPFAASPVRPRSAESAPIPYVVPEAVPVPVLSKANANRQQQRVVDTVTSFKSETVWTTPDGDQLLRIARSDTSANRWTATLHGFTGFGPTLRDAYREADRKLRVSRHNKIKLLRQRARFARAALDSRVERETLREVVAHQDQQIADLTCQLERQTAARQQAEADAEQAREDAAKIITRMDRLLQQARRKRAAENQEAVTFVTVDLSDPLEAQNEISSLMYDGWGIQEMAVGGDKCVIMLTNMGSVALARMRPRSQKPRTAYEVALQNGVTGDALAAIGDREALDQARQVFDAAPKPPARRVQFIDNGARHDR